MEDRVSIFIRRTRQASAPNTGIIARYVSVLFLVVNIVAATGCAPQIISAESLAAETASPSPAATMSSATNPLIFFAEADAQVSESNPDANYGSSTYLQVDGTPDPGVESFIRFNITGVSSTIQNAYLRVYDTTNATKNGPAVYATDSSWSEDSITWKTRPARLGEVLDNRGSISTDTWVEYDVTSSVKGNGTASFVLVADSSDAATFSSRQGSQPPQLVITFVGGPTRTPAGATETPTAATTTPVSNNTVTLTPQATTAAGDAVFVGAGDISTCDNNNAELTAQLLESIPGTVFTTGDNAYEDGTTSQYNNCYNPTWGRLKERTRPVPGNHEYHTANAAGYFQYFDNIPPYYAYNLGSWRIYALNSEIGVSDTSPQVTWLKADLAANPSQCVLAYWHQPRWSSGTHHGSNKDYQALWQVLYQAGAELVLNGHEHNYERFAPMNAAGQPDPNGLREFVIGTGGNDHYDFGNPLPASEVRDDTSYGVLKLTLHSNSYDWQFIPAAGSNFTDSGSAECH
jgi:hypothetical protein